MVNHRIKKQSCSEELVPEDSCFSNVNFLHVCLKACNISMVHRECQGRCVLVQSKEVMSALNSLNLLWSELRQPGEIEVKPDLLILVDLKLNYSTIKLFRKSNTKF